MYNIIQYGVTRYEYDRVRMLVRAPQQKINNNGQSQRSVTVPYIQFKRLLAGGQGEEPGGKGGLK